jgi:hypothetical protein
MLKNTRQVFTSTNTLYKDISSPQTSNVIGITYYAINKDNNGDNILNHKDKVSLATSDLDGTHYRVLIEDIEEIYSATQISNDRLLILYQKDSKTLSQLYSLPVMQPISEHIIPQITLD